MTNDNNVISAYVYSEAEDDYVEKDLNSFEEIVELVKSYQANADRSLDIWFDNFSGKVLISEKPV